MMSSRSRLYSLIQLSPARKHVVTAVRKTCLLTDRNLGRTPDFTGLAICLERLGPGSVKFDRHNQSKEK